MSDPMDNSALAVGDVITANIKRAFTLSGTSADLDVAAEDVLLATLTKTGSAANLVEATLKVDFTHEG